MTLFARLTRISVVPCWLLLAGCQWFVSPQDAIRLQNFTSLKAMHMKLYDDWTKGSGREWSLSNVTSYCDSGDLRFHEAFEYARSSAKKDETAPKAVKILWDQFSADCKKLIDKDKPFNAVFMKELRPMVEQNYDYAIAGETARVADK